MWAVSLPAEPVAAPSFSLAEFLRVELDFASTVAPLQRAVPTTPTPTLPTLRPLQMPWMTSTMSKPWLITLCSSYFN